MGVEKLRKAFWPWKLNKYPFEIPHELLIWKLEEISLWAGGITVTRAGRLWTLIW